MVVVPRAPTPTIEQQEVFRPVAAPVDTYIRAPDPAPSNLHQLADGLQNFSRDIRGMFQAREARDEEAARLRGEAQFFKDNQIGYAEAVRTGKIPAFQSKPFMSAYKEAEGKVIGARLASQMQLEYQTWDGRNTQDPANFDVFMADFLKRNLTQDDTDVLKGAMPYIYSTVNAGYTQRTQDAADATYNGGLNAQIAVNSMAIDDFSDSLGTDYDALWEELVANRGSALTSGIRTLDYDSKLIDAIAAKALEAKDPALLALLDKPLPGESNPISATPYGREVKTRTISAMETINSQADNAAYTAQQRRDAALKGELTSFALEAIMADPDTVLPDNFWAAFSKVEPEARVKVQEWRNAALRGVIEDPELVSDLTYRVLIGGENAMEIIGRNAEHLDGATVKKLYDMGQETPVWQSSQSYKIGLQTIQAKANEGNDLAINPNYVSPAASAASMDFELSMRAWSKTEAGQLAIQNNDVASIATEVGRVQGIIMGGFDSSMSEQATYAVPEEIVDIRDEAGMASNPLAPTQASIAEATAADAARAASPAGQMNEWVSGTVPDINALPEQEQNAIREEADRRGIDPQIFLEETYKQVDAILKELEAGAAIDRGIQDVLDNAPQQSQADPDIFNLSGLPSVAESGEQIPVANSGGTAESSNFVPPASNLSDLVEDVLSRYDGKRLPASIRLNNMGGISINGDLAGSWAARQPGFVGAVKRPPAEGGYYAQYATPEDGVRAASNLLIRYGEQGVNTPAAIADRWAEGGLSAYVATTTKYLREAGFEVDANTALDLNDPDVRLAILRAKSAHESGFGRPTYNDAVYQRAIQAPVRMASN